MAPRGALAGLLAAAALCVPSSTARASAPSCPAGGFAVGAAAVDVTPRPPAGQALADVHVGGYG
ncbi:MAG: hypothetical protein QOG11_1541, partial [Solirubrobacteraceae bacterium]|nr:hypothetical protein [Solirubrobacteraceae bacterium]